jgi:glutamate synthase (NADPH/NADH) small chain
LARRGHTVTIFEKRSWGGGLSTYGIIALREPLPVALAEVEMIRSLGVTIETSAQVNAAELPRRFDAVFVAAGLGKSPQLGILGEEHIVDGLEFIEQSKMDIQNLRVGRNVLVIGAGNTAIDCATVAKRCGADRVTMVYRRTQNEMSAYRHEYEFIKNEGVGFEFLAQPVSATAEGLECVRVVLNGNGMQPVQGSNFVLGGDQIIKAVGQQKTHIALGLATERGFIKVNAQLETSLPRVYAGGDCIRSRGSASTVMAAQDGKIGAASIHGLLMNEVKNG